MTAADFRHGLPDPDVPKQRIRVRDHGVYVDMAALERALRERDVRLDPGKLDRG